MTPIALSRRQFAGGMAAMGVLAAPRYKLGVMTSMYAALPLDEAMKRVRKAGFNCISPARKHASDVVYSTDLPKAERARMLRRIRDLGVEPVMSLGGFGGSDPSTEAGLGRYMAEIDLSADFEIPVIVGVV